MMESCLLSGWLLADWGELWHLGSLLFGEHWNPPDDLSLPCQGVEGLQLLPWAEGSATTSHPRSC